MQAIIPDTLNGALILSVIDFFLSFFIIAGIGVVLSLFPIVGRFIGQGIKPAAPAPAATPQPASPVVVPAITINEKHLMALSAAIYAVTGPHRIIHIEASEASADGRA